MSSDNGEKGKLYSRVVDSIGNELNRSFQVFEEMGRNLGFSGCVAIGSGLIFLYSLVGWTVNVAVNDMREGERAKRYNEAAGELRDATVRRNEILEELVEELETGGVREDFVRDYFANRIGANQILHERAFGRVDSLRWEALREEGRGGRISKRSEREYARNGFISGLVLALSLGSLLYDGEGKKEVRGVKND